MSPSSAAGTGDVRRSIDNISTGENITGPAQANTMTAVKSVIATDQGATSTDREKKSWHVRVDKWLQVKVQGCFCDCCCIYRNQQRGTLLLRLLVLAQFGFVVGVDIYTGLCASAGFVFIAAWASLAVSAVASVINMVLAHFYEEYELIGTLCLVVGIVWAPVEIVSRSSAYAC
jgi:hypothetical protein